MQKPIKLNPKKLLNSKWTAVVPSNKEKHFMVVKLIKPQQETLQITHVMLEAVHSKRTQIVAWRSHKCAGLVARLAVIWLNQSI